MKYTVACKVQGVARIWVEAETPAEARLRAREQIEDEIDDTFLDWVDLELDSVQVVGADK